MLREAEEEASFAPSMTNSLAMSCGDRSRVIQGGFDQSLRADEHAALTDGGQMRFEEEGC